MTQLANLQQSFAAAMLDVAIPPPNSIRGARRRSVAHRFDIHRNKIATVLIEALASRYPVTRRLIGPESFRALARLYITRNPPRSSILIGYGDCFPRFVRSLGDIPSIEYLADITELESTFSRAYHAADATPLSIDAFSRLSPDLLEDLVVSLHPSVSLVASRFPIVAIWEANRNDEDGPSVIRWAAEAALVARPDSDVEVWLLPTGGYAFLTALMAGATLAEATQSTAGEDADFDLTANLETLISARICIGFDNLALLAA